MWLYGWKLSCNFFNKFNLLKTPCWPIAHERQFVVTCTVCVNDILALLDIWRSNTPVRMLCPQNNCMSLYFCKNVTCWSVGLLRISQVFSRSRKIVWWWVMTKCLLMSDMWIHRKTALEVTCMYENLKVVLMWYERWAYNVNELVDTSCVAVCIGSESVLPSFFLPLAADR